MYQWGRIIVAVLVHLPWSPQGQQSKVRRYGNCKLVPYITEGFSRA